MSVELIITQGSNAGSVAPIHPGYYLVGRNKQCQIRPKSRSVSRQHCLLLHNDDGFGALDLKSTRGTFVNGDRLQPHRWQVLADGDQIRFGKVVFNVAIKQSASHGQMETVNQHAMAGSSAAASVASQMQTGGSTIALSDGDDPTPESWQNLDVAEFLEEPGAEDSSVFADSAIGIAKPSDTMVGDVPDETVTETEHEKAVDVDPAPRKRPPRRAIDHNEYKRPAKKSIRLPTLRFSAWGDLSAGEERWKIWAAVTFLVAVLGLFAFQIHRFSSGPDIQIRRNLD
ncbi:FHA domain-containing protein [Stieleria sp. TO1_6]|uniref:FHA domain-containing protein n=1 Tax=Stieleria tagensis TaxID=2956795 RepID=UPI00209B9D7E|nr:FHA domain-containing protein [Stieleria tagensis]MCO8120351.1 FHA domain-containing protein [Stieleria tagensis]